jgi:hypothetical protein
MKREPVGAKPRAVREVMPVSTNAEAAILTKEFGRQRLLRTSHSSKSPSGISVRFDEASNVTDVNVLHALKTDLPTVETEEGTVKEGRL